MEYFEIPGLKRKVSRFVFGTAIADMCAGRSANELLDHALANGIDTFDTARSYGEAEISLGRWIKEKGVREQMNILTKGCIHTPERSRVTVEDLTSDFTTSLKKLDVEYVDIYLLHRDDPTQPVDGIVDTLNRFCDEGKLLSFGGSNWTHQRIEQANEYAYKHSLRPFTASSPCFSLAEQIGDPWGGSIHISGPSNKEAREWYIRNDMPVIAYSGLARGFLSGKFDPDGDKTVENSFTRLGKGIAAEYDYPENHERLRRVIKMAKEKHASVPQIAIAWTLSQRMFVAPILSPSSIKHLDDNLAAFDMRLTEDECGYLDLKDN